ncbi:YhgE/Pip domain-containing protein [Cohnella thailandensis]|uniref:DUF3533 domain-containing protein n=1 Tax=Cohnella thailandensis TaxID=557557 RepID=A0A841SQU6_9BACL|nr:hypothetical protein [Cohnella thailandensis]MBB6634324.1 hypothetical protein [Cohnella thailandensis]MBP1972177.1 putative phage infection (PIP) family protein YhgE [Cohnella thailandensis]
MKNVLMLLKNKAFITGFVMFLFFQSLMLLVFLPGYTAIPKNIPAMTVALLNNDKGETGAEIAKGLSRQLPFKLDTHSSLEQAKEDLENREIHMIIQVPEDFSEKVSNPGEQVNLNFFINQSNPSTAATTMQSVVTQVTSALNAQFAVQTVQGTLQQLNVGEEEAAALAAGVPSKIAANMVLSNPVPAGMHNQMAPMFLPMSIYTGAMMFTMISLNGFHALKRKMGKWQSFFALQGANLVVSIVAPLAGLAIYFLIQGHSASSFFGAWLSHSLEAIASIEFMSILYLVFGQMGSIVNIPIMLTMTIANGAVMAPEMMYPFFKFLSQWTVMYYPVHLDFNFLFGGGGTGELLLKLALYAVVCMAIVLGLHFWKYNKKEVTPALGAAPAAPAAQPAR